jgi:hypothetical protein
MASETSVNVLIVLSSFGIFAALLSAATAIVAWRSLSQRMMALERALDREKTASTSAVSAASTPRDGYVDTFYHSYKNEGSGGRATDDLFIWPDKP